MSITEYRVEDFVCDETFQQYCTGANPAQVLFWEEWAAAHPAQAADMDAARQLVQLLSAQQGNRLEQLQQLRNGLLQSSKLQALLQHEALHADRDASSINASSINASGMVALHNTAATNPAPAPAKPRRRYWPYISAAAAVAGVLWMLQFISHPVHTPIAFINPTTVFAAGDQPRTTVVLPDGSVITLRSHSKAMLDTGFNSSNRRLSLEGEAYFDVSHEAARPFIVRTQQAEITVLGTQFNVSAYPGKGTETSLFRGQVAVQDLHSSDPAVLLTRNQKVIIGGAATATTAKTILKATPLVTDHKGIVENAWVHSRLEIENEPLSEIAARLEQWYGIPIVFADAEVGQYRYSGTFESESITDALKAFQLSYAFNFEVENGRIVIRK